MKIITIVGARPQFIKAAALCRAIAHYPLVEHILVHTGQHSDDNMSDIFFREMNIPRPDYNFNINTLPHGAMTGQMLEKIEEVLLKERPDKLVVFGDTNSTLAGALAASKLHVPVAHIESGMRSFDNAMPEEINRILTDRLSTELYCSSETAINNLKKEGFEYFDCKMINVGDILYDTVIYYSRFSAQKTGIDFTKYSAEPYILATFHRAENIYDLHRLRNIVTAINDLAEQSRVIVPLHPATRKILDKNNLHVVADVIEPVGYFDILELIKNSALVMTDSGGLQKEAYFLKRHCITMRDNTEWVELTSAGYNILTGTDTDKIVKQSLLYLGKIIDTTDNIYGSGNTSEMICKYLVG